jgi:hypothetical protein
MGVVGITADAPGDGGWAVLRIAGARDVDGAGTVVALTA